EHLHRFHEAQGLLYAAGRSARRGRAVAAVMAMAKSILNKSATLNKLLVIRIRECAGGRLPARIRRLSALRPSLLNGCATLFGASTDRPHADTTPRLPWRRGWACPPPARISDSCATTAI